MTKPEGIEQWAWDRAETALVLSDWPMMVRDDFDNARPIIARAIQDAVMQERLACVNIVETLGPQHYYNQHGQERHMSEIEYALSQAIRNRG